MAETYFDTSSGKLVIGGVAIEQALQESANSLLPLRDLLVDENFAYHTGDFPGISIEDWQKEDYKSYGKWLLLILNETASDTTPLHQKHLRRAHALGIGPDDDQIRKRSGFQKHSRFQREIGSPFNRIPIGAYDNWTQYEFVAYAERVSKAVGGRPSLKDYDRFAAQQMGPSYMIFLNRFGGTRDIHEQIGYPHIPEWTEDDYIDWGIKVMHANKRPLHWLDVEILSAADRGPSARSIAKYFSGFKNFAERVAEDERLLREQQIASTTAKLETYQSALRDGTLPHQWTELSVSELLTRAAKYQLLDALCKQPVSEGDKMLVAQRDTIAFVRSLRKLDPTLTEDAIEREAMERNLYDDIWKSGEYLEYLYIPAETREAWTEKKRQKHRRRVQHKPQIAA